MTWYLLEFSDRKNAANYAWGLMGLAAKLAQSVRLGKFSTFQIADDHLSTDRIAYDKFIALYDVVSQLSSL